MVVRIRLVRPVLASSVALLLSCGGGGGADSGGATNAGTLDTSGSAADSTGPAPGTGATDSSADETGVVTPPEESLAHAYCDKMFSCCTDAEILAELGFFEPPPDSVESCLQTFVPLVGLENSGIVAAAEEGRVAYDVADVPACAAALAASSCEDWSVRGDLFRDMVEAPECLGLVTPLAADGEYCRHDRECISENCNLVDDVCDPPLLDLGEPCQFAYDCRAPYFCNPMAPGGSECTEGRAPGSDCNSNIECLGGICEGNDGFMMGICVVRCDGP